MHHRVPPVSKLSPVRYKGDEEHENNEVKKEKKKKVLVQ
jgi:hypothetical protein